MIMRKFNVKNFYFFVDEAHYKNSSFYQPGEIQNEQKENWKQNIKKKVLRLAKQQ